jgi:hypothetical protein
MVAADVASLISSFIQKTSQDEPHLAGGLSTHFKCALSQIMDRLHPVEFKAQGVMAPGKAFHVWIQERLPSGIRVGNFLIIGHEQYVIIHTDAGHRRSPIDTLVFNTESNEYEIWDWKTTQIDLQYINDLDEIYQAQANIYAQSFKQAWGLKHDPMCRVIYVSKDNWCDVKPFAFKSTRALYQDSLKKIADVDSQLRAIALGGEEKMPLAGWRELADGLEFWSHTKKKYRKTCRYCDHKSRCHDLIQAKCDVGEIDTAEVVF